MNKQQKIDLMAYALFLQELGFLMKPVHRYPNKKVEMYGIKKSDMSVWSSQEYETILDHGFGPSYPIPNAFLGFSDEFRIIDIDDGKDHSDQIWKIIGEPFMTSQSNRGMHYYFLNDKDDPVDCSLSYCGLKMDILGNKNGVYIPGSWHPKSNRPTGCIHISDLCASLIEGDHNTLLPASTISNSRLEKLVKNIDYSAWLNHRRKKIISNIERQQTITIRPKKKINVGAVEYPRWVWARKKLYAAYLNGDNDAILEIRKKLQESGYDTKNMKRVDKLEEGLRKKYR